MILFSLFLFSRRKFLRQSFSLLLLKFRSNLNFRIVIKVQHIHGTKNTTPIVLIMFNWQLRNSKYDGGLGFFFCCRVVSFLHQNNERHGFGMSICLNVHAWCVNKIFTFHLTNREYIVRTYNSEANQLKEKKNVFTQVC